MSRKASYLDLFKSTRRPSERRQRPCLRCGDTFLSEGKHNRVCTGCKMTPAWRDGADQDHSCGGPVSSRALLTT